MSNKSNSNKLKDVLLGEPHSTAHAKLRKMLLFKYATMAGHTICSRCHLPITDIKDFSIEHNTSWQKATDPHAVFFDLDDITFSHLKCNVSAADRSHLGNFNRNKTHCIAGHEFNAENTREYESRGHKVRDCRTCRRLKTQHRRADNVLKCE